MIREVGESIGRAVLDGIGRAASRVQERKPLPADLLESDDAYLAVFDAPGATAGDVAVRFEGDTLEVRIDRFREFHDGYEMRFPGRGLVLTGTVSLPEDADVEADRADATITDNGTLEVLIPKADHELPVGEADDETVEAHDVDESAAGPDEEATDVGEEVEDETAEETDGETAEEADGV